MEPPRDRRSTASRGGDMELPALARIMADEGPDNSKEILQRYLEANTIARLLPSPLPEMVVVGKESRVEEVLATMARFKLISVPVQDEKTQKYAGMFDVMDLVALSLSVLASQKDPEAAFFQQPVGKVINFSTCDVFSPMQASMSLYHLVETFTRGIVRVPVQDDAGRLIAIVSQSLAVKHLARTIKELGRSVDRPIDYLGLGKRAAITIDARQLALDGYALIDKHKVEAVAVTDERGDVVGAVSASDLRGLARDIFPALRRPLLDFIKGQGQPKPLTCNADAKLKDVILQLASANQNRVWIVGSKDRKPMGVVSNTDVMKALLLCLNVTPRRRKTRSVDFTKLTRAASSSKGVSP